MSKEEWVAPVVTRIWQQAPVSPGDFGVIGREITTTIWFDPGSTTGWCVVSVWDVALQDIRYRLLANIAGWSAGEYKGTEADITDQMMELVEAWEGSVNSVGLEDFILRKFSMGRELLAPVRIAARFEDRMYTNGKSGLLVPAQQPSLAMSMVTDERLKLWGFYNPTIGKPHARDALRHALAYLRRMKAIANQEEGKIS